MRISSPLFALVFALALAFAVTTTPVHAQYYAGAVLRGSQLAPSTAGVVVMLQPSGPGTNTTIVVAIKGLTAGQSYAFHIHTWGDLSSGIGRRNISTTTIGVGGHFNPMSVSHSCGYGNVRHVGDIGNFTATGTDSIQYFVSELIDLSFSNRTVVGRSFIVHTSGDQCTSSNNGNAGQPLMQGVIGIINPNNTNLQAFLNGAGMPRATSNMASLPLVSTGVSADVHYNQPLSAVAYLYRRQTADVGGQAVGVVRFFLDTTTNLVNVTAYITGLTANSVFGFHVHTWGDESDTMDPASTSAFALAGAHFSPIAGAQHGYPPASNRHLGDMGNITSDANGNVRFTALFDLLDLVTFNTSIIGRMVVVHAQRDDGTGLSGNSGARIMGGTIGISGQNVDVTTVDFTPYAVPSSNIESSASLATSNPLSVVVAAASTALFAALLMLLL